MTPLPSPIPRTLIYKRTHIGDPDARGRFGINGCMGRVRAWPFEAVIGVGGIGDEPTAHGIANRVTWIGLGPRRSIGQDSRGPLITFDHFLLLDRSGPVFSEVAPLLARRVYSRNIRATMRLLSPHEQREVAAILALANAAPPSRSARPRVRSRPGECSTCSARAAASRDQCASPTLSACRPTIAKRRHNGRCSSQPS